MKVEITKIEQRRTATAPEGTPPYIYEIFYTVNDTNKGSFEMFAFEFTKDRALKKLKEEILPTYELIGQPITLK